ncbi:hypothetical protein [Hymenobacter convexus]|uniref:hypothetical protein n=1 Tax=Hymenobacter sp. CA1UV-4 TaxID=3063782 RepID=UPI002712BE30|nr:hypothetical protein [Hymenobacter sp. CA1UV-4]MDO7852303.1 hypothetical protein [Hymenobacter sp. CA1UV-4]
MAGERLANQTIYVTQANLSDGSWVDVWLGGQYRRFTGALGSGSAVPLNTPRRFTILTTANANAADLQPFTVASFGAAVLAEL